MTDEVTRKLVALGVAVAVGAACRFFQISAPAPATLFGALLVLGITAGYCGVDWMQSRAKTPPTVSQSRAPKTLQ